MFDIKDFQVYDGSDLTDNHDVLVWSLKTGYYFTTYGEASEVKIVGML